MTSPSSPHPTKSSSAHVTSVFIINTVSYVVKFVQTTPSTQMGLVNLAQLQLKLVCLNNTESHAYDMSLVSRLSAICPRCGPVLKLSKSLTHSLSHSSEQGHPCKGMSSLNLFIYSTGFYSKCRCCCLKVTFVHMVG